MPQSSRFLIILALVAGCLLAVMIYFNGLMALHLNPMSASIGVHVSGSFAALVLMFFWKSSKTGASPPWWAYFSGVSGALVVVIVGVTVNSPIGVAGTVSLFLIGQILMGWLCDFWGLFGVSPRKIGLPDVLQVALVLAGAGVLIYG